MPSTQAYTVDWDVTIAGQVVTRDVVELTVQQEQDKPDSATVGLDTSVTPHAVENDATISIKLNDGNASVEFNGRVDSVKDGKTSPEVTIDAREPEGNLDDVSAVAYTDEQTLFDVIDRVVTDSPGKVRGLKFDAASLKNQYGTFGSSVVYGTVEAYSIPPGLGSPSQEETWIKQETTNGQGKPAEIAFDYYTNTTGTRYQAVLTGKDGNGDTVEAIFDLPPGTDAVDAYGTDSFKLPAQGGTGLFHEINGVSTDLPSSADTISFGATVKNYIKTDFNFRADDDQSVRDALDTLTGYISTLDDGNDWRYYVTAPTPPTNPELIIEPVPDNPAVDRYVFTEGDNVLRPVANRSLDGVYNMVKVSGQGDVNVWAWAFDGTYYYTFTNPFTADQYPDNPTFPTTYGNTGGVNDIDEIDLRATGIDAPNADDVFQANNLAEEAIKQLYRTPVSGVATVTGLHPAYPGDEAEVYYPSRGIPAKVVDNIYTVKSVEYQIATDEATTKIDFGITEPNTGDMIQAAAGGTLGAAVRDDLSGSVREGFGQEPTDGSDTFPLKGVVKAENNDGTFVVKGEDGNTYDPVDIV